MKEPEEKISSAVAKKTHRSVNVERRSETQRSAQSAFLFTQGMVSTTSRFVGPVLVVENFRHNMERVEATRCPVESQKITAKEQCSSGGRHSQKAARRDDRQDNTFLEEGRSQNVSQHPRNARRRLTPAGG